LASNNACSDDTCANDAFSDYVCADDVLSNDVRSDELLGCGNSTDAKSDGSPYAADARGDMATNARSDATDDTDARAVFGSTHTTDARTTNICPNNAHSDDNLPDDRRPYNNRSDNI